MPGQEGHNILTGIPSSLLDMKFSGVEDRLCDLKILHCVDRLGCGVRANNLAMKWWASCHLIRASHGKTGMEDVTNEIVGGLSNHGFGVCRVVLRRSK